MKTSTALFLLFTSLVFLPGCAAKRVLVKKDSCQPLAGADLANCEYVRDL